MYFKVTDLLHVASLPMNYTNCVVHYWTFLFKKGSEKRSRWYIFWVTRCIALHFNSPNP